MISQTNGSDHSLKVGSSTPLSTKLGPLINTGVPQGWILGPILFILFIIDFHKAVDFSTVHHFADDTNLLLTENTIKKLNKHISRDLKFVVQWISKYRKNKDCHFQIKK